MGASPLLFLIIEKALSLLGLAIVLLYIVISENST